MNIIWLTSETPYPPNTGGRMVMYKHIEPVGGIKM